MGKDLEILYEDNHLIVVIKPFNVLSQKDDTNDIDMLTIIKAYLKEKYHKPFNVYLGLVHRLDRVTGGVMVFAKTSKCAKRLCEDIRNHKFEKKYLAVVHGKLEKDEDTLVNYIMKKDNKALITNSKLGKEAILNYKVLDYKKDLSLLDITLTTGRYNQIRCQFSNIKHSLYGDQKYGLKDKKQLALYAYYLSFNHPITKNKMEFINYPKKDGIWKSFLKEE